MYSSARTVTHAHSLRMYSRIEVSCPGPSLIRAATIREGTHVSAEAAHKTII